MNKTQKQLSNFICFALFIFFAVYFLFHIRNDFSETERELFWTLFISYIICGGLVVAAKFQHQLYIFEPFTLISLIYIGVFNYRPIIDLYHDNLVGNGVIVLSGGTKATIIFTVGFICFYIGYYLKLRSSGQNKVGTLAEIEGNIENDNSDSSNWALIGWIICFILVITALVSQGNSLRYIFTLTSSGEKVDEGRTSLLFLSNLGVTMATFWLIVLVKPGKPVIKVIITILSLMYLIMRNGRWLLLIFVSAPVIYYYIKRKKRPNLWLVVGGAIGLLLVFAWMQVNRPNIRFGRQLQGWGENGLTLEILLSPFDSDLSTYKVFYGMVTRFPSMYSYMHGVTFLYTFLLFVPRVIWPGKPDNPVRDMIEMSMNNQARQAGSAVANIGEIYANFGVLGVIILMFIFGKVVSKLKDLYEKPNQDTIIAYSILLPLLFQWVARGNFSGNFYLTIFAMLPFIVKGIIRNFLRSRS